MSEDCCLIANGFMWERKYEEIYNSWKETMTLPPPHYYYDYKHGSLKSNY